MLDYKVPRIEQADEEELTYFALFSYCDPVAFKDAVLESKWKKAMDEEIAAIERNNSCELIELSKGKKTIGVKWVYKTKLKENEEVDKYKARLAAKGYKQEFRVDYQEVFSPVARHDTIRLVISLATQNSWPVFQLDVKSAFLHGDLDEFRMKDDNPVNTLIDAGMKLARNPEGKKVNSTLYKQMVGSLMYLTAIRPDIMHVVSLISRYMESSKEMHLLAAKIILRYLKGTVEYGLFYKNGEKSNMFGFTDNDFARALDDRKSTSGYVFIMGTVAISWSSRKQPTMTLSTIEVEFVAATSCACQAIWLQRILEECHFK
ncbi:hypothetical protein SLEP1_g34527 [Rubroshorea leprosula]|uniref:Reverse transcriptase Ty1/copia-type domain-containing protein n=1 Tax=Rubroshorea leprosula TaxID=152421 RepID=A0AAV5KKK2_9ROSI|nr:hypothetical protein SLEP1_g34527 [Rubroshorea leprosula]